MSDNYRFDIAGGSLERSLQVAFSQNSMATHWAIDKDGKRLILFWTECTGATPLPVPMRVEGTLSFVRAWLESLDYGPMPDTDGHCTQGWRVYNESWGHVAGKWQAFVAIEPYWNLHGK